MSLYKPYSGVGSTAKQLETRGLCGRGGVDDDAYPPPRAIRSEAGEAQGHHSPNRNFFTGLAGLLACFTNII